MFASPPPGVSYHEVNLPWFYHQEHRHSSKKTSKWASIGLAVIIPAGNRGPRFPAKHPPEDVNNAVALPPLLEQILHLPEHGMQGHQSVQGQLDIPSTHYDIPARSKGAGPLPDLPSQRFRGCFTLEDALKYDEILPMTYGTICIAEPNTLNTDNVAVRVYSYFNSESYTNPFGKDLDKLVSSYREASMILRGWKNIHEGTFSRGDLLFASSPSCSGQRLPNGIHLPCSSPSSKSQTKRENSMFLSKEIVDATFRSRLAPDDTSSAFALGIPIVFQHESQETIGEMRTIFTDPLIIKHIKELDTLKKRIQFEVGHFNRSIRLAMLTWDKQKKKESRKKSEKRSEPDSRTQLLTTMQAFKDLLSEYRSHLVSLDQLVFGHQDGSCLSCVLSDTSTSSSAINALPDDLMTERNARKNPKVSGKVRSSAPEVLSEKVTHAQACLENALLRDNWPLTSDEGPGVILPGVYGQISPNRLVNRTLKPDMEDIRAVHPMHRFLFRDRTNEEIEELDDGEDKMKDTNYDGPHDQHYYSINKMYKRLKELLVKDCTGEYLTVGAVDSEMRRDSQLDASRGQDRAVLAGLKQTRTAYKSFEEEVENLRRLMLERILELKMSFQSLEQSLHPYLLKNPSKFEVDKHVWGRGGEIGVPSYQREIGIQFERIPPDSEKDIRSTLINILSSREAQNEKKIATMFWDNLMKADQCPSSCHLIQSITSRLMYSLKRDDSISTEEDDHVSKNKEEDKSKKSITAMEPKEDAIHMNRALFGEIHFQVIHCPYPMEKSNEKRQDYTHIGVFHYADRPGAGESRQGGPRLLWMPLDRSLARQLQHGFPSRLSIQFDHETKDLLNEVNELWKSVNDRTLYTTIRLHDNADRLTSQIVSLVERLNHVSNERFRPGARRPLVSALLKGNYQIKSTGASGADRIANFFEMTDFLRAGMRPGGLGWFGPALIEQIDPSRHSGLHPTTTLCFDVNSDSNRLILAPGIGQSNFISLLSPSSGHGLGQSLDLGKPALTSSDWASGRRIFGVTKKQNGLFHLTRRMARSDQRVPLEVHPPSAHVSSDVGLGLIHAHILANRLLRSYKEGNVLSGKAHKEALLTRLSFRTLDEVEICLIVEVPFNPNDFDGAIYVYSRKTGAPEWRLIPDLYKKGGCRSNDRLINMIRGVVDSVSSRQRCLYPTKVLIESDSPHMTMDFMHVSALHDSVTPTAEGCDPHRVGTAQVDISRHDGRDREITARLLQAFFCNADWNLGPDRTYFKRYEWRKFLICHALDYLSIDQFDDDWLQDNALHLGSYTGTETSLSLIPRNTIKSIMPMGMQIEMTRGNILTDSVSVDPDAIPRLKHLLDRMD